MGAPDRRATSPAPVASINRPAKIASRPTLFSVMMPLIFLPSITSATKQQCKMGMIPASRTKLSVTTLKASPSKVWLSDLGSGAVAPISMAQFANSRSMPSESMVPSSRHQANPSTPTALNLPPKNPNRSTKVTEKAGRVATKAADRPPVPQPSTATSVS